MKEIEFTRDCETQKIPYITEVETGYLVSPEYVNALLKETLEEDSELRNVNFYLSKTEYVYNGVLYEKITEETKVAKTPFLIKIKYANFCKKSHPKFVLLIAKNKEELAVYIDEFTKKREIDKKEIESIEYTECTMRDKMFIDYVIDTFMYKKKYY